MKIVYNKAIPFILAALMSAPALSMLAPKTTDDNTLLPTVSAQLDDNVQAQKWQKSTEALRTQHAQLKASWDSEGKISEEQRDARRILKEELHSLLNPGKFRTDLEEIREIIGWGWTFMGSKNARELAGNTLLEQFFDIQTRIQKASLAETEKESLQQLQGEIFKEFQEQFHSAATRCRLTADQESPKAQQRLAALSSSLDI